MCMHICMYVGIYVCKHVRMAVCMYLSTYACRVRSYVGALVAIFAIIFSSDVVRYFPLNK